MKKTLNDQMIAAFKPAASGKRYEVRDAVVPGFAVRVTDSGSKSFVLYTRVRGVPVRRTIGAVGAVGLAKARETARGWLEQISEGKDPKDEDEARALAEAQAGAGRFGEVAERYFKLILTTQKKRNEIERILRVHFVAPWLTRPIAGIKTKDVASIITAKAAQTPGAARQMLSHIKQLFKWAAASGEIDYSPCASIDGSTLLGSIQKRSRVLTDDELIRLWNGTGEMGYPVGPIYQLLVLTGCRLNEVVQARWSEFDLDKRLWSIPAARMKGGQPHVIPLTPMMLDILASLPRQQGDGLFCLADGRPVRLDSFGAAVDARCQLENWTNHDIRRSMRTRLSPRALGIERHVQELMIAHVQQGVIGIYDHHEYLEEKAAGFEAWSKVVRALVGKDKKPPRKLRLVA